MNGILVKQNGIFKHVEFEKGNTLEKMQKLVGGYIECISLGDDLVMVVDEEGKLKNKPINELATRIFSNNSPYFDTIVGDAIICHISLLD